MSHSKFTKRGRSLYLDNWNPSAKKYVNVCKICGHRGYSPVIEQAEFLNDPMNRGIYSELKRTLKPLPLDDLGRCEYCAKIQDGHFSAK